MAKSIVALNLFSFEADELQQFLLDFLYGGKIDVNKDILMDVLHKLEIAQVRDRGSEYDEGII